MIRYLGSVGAFIKLNDNENKTYKLLDIFSSSAKNNVLFSASINNLTGLVTTYGNITASYIASSLYINGESGSVIPSKGWNHITFSFDKRLFTYDENDFLVRFGDSSSSNFNIQNLYILPNSLSKDFIEYIHEEFTGAGNKTLRIIDSASFSINIIDTYESNFISPLTGNVYQPIKGQKYFSHDVSAATSQSLSIFISASLFSSDSMYIDTYLLKESDKVLSFEDNQIYQLTSSANLIPVSSSIGDFVRITFGQEYGNLFYLNTASGFINTQGIAKINHIQNIF